MNKHLLSILALTTLVAPSLHATMWKTDVPTALEQAAAQGKQVLVLFTGSDWCASCIAMKKHLLSTPEFAAYAQEHFVLVELDFPRKPLPRVLAAANSKQQQKYGVKSLPTLLVLSPEGMVIGARVGRVSRLDDLKEAFARVTEPSEEFAEVLANLSAESAITRDKAYEALYEMLPMELAGYNAFFDHELLDLIVEADAEREAQQQDAAEQGDDASSRSAREAAGELDLQDRIEG